MSLYNNGAQALLTTGSDGKATFDVTQKRDLWAGNSAHCNIDARHHKKCHDGCYFHCDNQSELTESKILGVICPTRLPVGRG